MTGTRWRSRLLWVTCKHTDTPAFVLSSVRLTPFPEGGLRYTNADTCSAKGAWSSRCSNKSRLVAPSEPKTQTYHIDRFSYPQVDPKTSKPIPAHSDTLWEVEVKTASPVRNTPEMPLSVSVEAVMEVQILMKGLLDLRRQDS